MLKQVQGRATRYILHNYVSDYKSRLICLNMLPLMMIPQQDSLLNLNFSTLVLLLAKHAIHTSEGSPGSKIVSLVLIQTCLLHQLYHTSRSSFDSSDECSYHL
uniref:Uncharacterized protein n=1 Tax=Amphimedon queenslandica TaxID=400682 RepID=A0A1X7VDD3_AMPQE